MANFKAISKRPSKFRDQWLARVCFSRALRCDIPAQVN